jgi:endo-1,4-beta-xylanase
MKTKTLITALLIVTILASCAPTATTVPLTTTPVPTATAIPPTEQPHIQLQQDIILYSGPGNADFNKIATLKAGESVSSLGIYVDFVQVMAKVEGSDVIGFIWKNDLGNLPGNLPQVTADSVPWKQLSDLPCHYNNPLGINFTVSHNTQSAAIPLIRSLRIRMDSIIVLPGEDGSGAITFSGILGDQNVWWKNNIRMDIRADNTKKYNILIRDGSSENWNYSLVIPSLDVSQPMQIIFDQPEGKSFIVLDGKDKQILRLDLTTQLGLNLPDGLFPEGKVYIGSNASPISYIRVTGLKVGVVSDGKWSNECLGLAELASMHNLTIGTEFNIDQAMNNENYQTTMNSNFNVAALSDFSWKGYWLGPGQYDFSNLDREVNYAVSKGWRVRAMHLVWGDRNSAIPDWLINSQFTRDEYIKILEQHVKTLVNRYKGKIQEWSIANEYSSRTFYGPPGEFWNEKIGPEYIEMSFRWAREADPNGILIFNDNNNESPRDSITSWVFDKMYYTVKDLKAKGVPIDVVGMQMHLLLRKWNNSVIRPKKEDVIATMHKFSDLGVKIYITEFDVDLHDRAGTPEERLQFQANIYRDMLEACLESSVCESFTIWGVSDSTSWLTQTCQEAWCVNEPDADPLLFDRDYNPKPAYFTVRDVLLNFSDTSSP